MRVDGRENLDFRPMEFRINYLKHPLSSVYGILGDTHVLVSVNFSESLPDFCKGMGHGWITSEYRLLPSSTPSRNTNINNSRSQEIRRLISRSLRSAFDLYKFPKYNFIVDCEVIQADGGTRVACINSAFLALVLAFNKLSIDPLKMLICAMSFAIINNDILLDPNYLEDSSADIDLNIVVNSLSGINELQFSAEKEHIKPHLLQKIIDISLQKSDEIFNIFFKIFEKEGINVVKSTNL